MDTIRFKTDTRLRKRLQGQAFFYLHVTRLAIPFQVLRFIGNVFDEIFSVWSLVIDRQSRSNELAAAGAFPFLTFNNVQADTLPIPSSVGLFSTNPTWRVWARLVVGSKSRIAGVATKVSRMLRSSSLPGFPFKWLLTKQAHQSERWFPFVVGRAHPLARLEFRRRGKVSTFDSLIPGRDTFADEGLFYDAIGSFASARSGTVFGSGKSPVRYGEFT